MRLPGGAGGGGLLERIESPEEVAEAVVFLASEDAPFVTGQVLAPNGSLVI